MASMNRVFLAGNLTKDPEVRYTPSGRPVGDLQLAVSRKFKLQDGTMKDEVCFVGIVVWGAQAENCGKYLTKGSPVLVEGRLQYEEWEKDGQKRNRLRVVADRVQFLSSGRGGGGARRGAGDSEENGGAPAGDSGPDMPSGPAAGGDDDNLPF